MEHENAIKRFIGSTVGLVLAWVVGVVVAVWVLVASQSVRKQINTHGIIVLIIATTALISLLAYVDILAARASTARNRAIEAESRVSQLTDELTEARELPHTPTARDKALFDAFVQTLPANSGACYYLREVYTGKNWSMAKLAPLEKFYNENLHDAFFIDELVEEKREDLRDAVSQFLQSSNIRGFPVEGREDDIFALKSPSAFEGGYTEWSEVRELMQDLRDNVLDAHEALLRTGRKRGL